MKINCSKHQWARWIGFCSSPLGGFILQSATARADIVELVNGDHYSGTVLAMTMTNVTLRSAIQGVISLPRQQVVSINLGHAGPKASLQPSLGLSNAMPTARVLASLPGRLPATGVDTNIVAQVQKQILEGAAPEATQKYNQMAQSYLAGSLSLGDLRKQAQQAIREAEQAKQDLGPDAEGLLDGYLSILQGFIQESTPTPAQR